MAEKHPYISSAAAITTAVQQLRKTFPSKVTAETLRQLGIAPNNESYLINILRFVGVINADGTKTSQAASTFSHYENDAFQKAFEKMVKDAYKKLFDVRDEEAWKLDSDKLISFFRSTDQTSDIVGKRQAATFQALSSLAGHGEPPVQAKAKVMREPKPKTPRTKGQNGHKQEPPPDTNGSQARNFGLSVRIEVNLPQAADQETYDRIFRSIRENLINAK